MSRRDDDADRPNNDFEIMSTFDAAPYKAEWTTDGHVTEESVYAWLDGALDASDAEAIEQHVRQCSVCAAIVAEARGFIAASARIMNAADLSPSVARKNVVSRDEVVRAARDVITLASQSMAGPQRAGNWHSAGARTPSKNGATTRRWHESPYIRIAAALLLMAGGSFVFVRGDSKRDRAGGDSTIANRPDIAAVATNTRNLQDSVRTASLNAKRITDSVNAFDGRERIRSAAAKETVAENANSVSKATSAANVEVESKRTSVLAVVPVAATPAAASPVRRTIAGTVTDRSSASPLATASVFVTGTSLQATTDTAGNFTLTNVPASAKIMEIRRLGYASLSVSLDTLRGSARSIDIRLETRPMMLEGVTVSAVPDPPRATRSTFAAAITTAVERPIAEDAKSKAKRNASESTPNVLCMVSVDSSVVDSSPSGVSGKFVPLVRGVHATLKKRGQYDATLRGWPRETDEKRMTLKSDSTGVLRGTARSGSMRLEVEMTPDGDYWLSTLVEYRGANVRTENIRFRNDADSATCR